MLYSKEVEVPLTVLMSFRKDYEALGYNIDKLKDQLVNDFKETGKKLNTNDYASIIVKIPIEHLKKGSKVEIDVLCDYCKEEGQETIFKQPYQRFWLAQEPLAKDCCRKHKGKKMADVNMINHGVNNSFNIPKSKEKMKKTIRERYGVENVSQSEEIKRKKAETTRKNYGVDSPLQSKEIQEKTQQTNKENYGVPFTFQSEEIKEKIEKVMIERYGVNNPMKYEKIKDKSIRNAVKARGESGTVVTSVQQKYIYSIYGGYLNYPLDKINIDIAFPEIKLAIEYDGSGHDLSVKYGQLTEEEFQQGEIRRYYFLKTNGWKTMRIVSLKDKLPSPKKLKEMLLLAKSYLYKDGHSWIEFNITENYIKLTTGNESFDFGELQSIKKIEEDESAIL